MGVPIRSTTERAKSSVANAADKNKNDRRQRR